MSGNLTNHIELQSFDLYNRIEQIHRQPTAAPENIRAKYILLYKVLEQACYELTAGVTFSFANLFSRLDYICKEKRMTPSDKYAIQTMRRNCNAAMRDDFRPVMEELDYPFSLERIPYAIALGIFCGLVAWYFTRSMNWIENIFRRYSNPYVKFVIGGAMLSILIFLFPPLYGEGYDTISLLLNGETSEEWDTVMNNSLFYGSTHLLVVYLILIILFKVFASSATNGGGGCGGIFAPSLFLGCISGFVFSYVCNEFHIGNTYIPEKNFALMGMAGLMSGVMHAPLTGIFLIAELTGGYDLFLPLMIVSVCAYLTIIVFEPHSIYSMRLAKTGELITHHKDKAVLTLMNMESIVETDFLKVRPDMDLGEMVKRISQSSRNLFPVVDVNDELIGIVILDDIRNIIFRQELYHRFRVESFMKPPKAPIISTDSMEVVMKKFDQTGAWNLPVVDEDNKYIGFVSKSKMLNTYRQVLVDISAE